MQRKTSLKRNSKKKQVEIEVRFIEIDKNKLIKRLIEIGAKDLGEDLLRETIFYNEKEHWRDIGKFVRMRQTKKGIFVTFKEKSDLQSIEVVELEFQTNTWNTTELFLQELGIQPARFQEKKRHTFKIEDVTIDIDTWPSVPSYVEIEGPSEKRLKEVAENLRLKWENVIFGGAAYVLSNFYNIPVKSLRYFTFGKIE